MRYWIAAALCAATMMSACVSQAADGTVAVKLNERDREYRNTGTITLRDPITGALLGSYEFATGGFGRGSAPFGTYELGAFRGRNDDPHRIGPRWMIKQQGQSEDGEAYDPRVNRVRTSLELHSARRTPGSQGCIAVLGGPEVWAEFMNNLHHIIDEIGQVVFTLEGNPEAAPPTPPDNRAPVTAGLHQRVAANGRSASRQ